MGEKNDLNPEADETFALYGLPGHLIRRLQQASVSLFIEETLEAGFDLTPVQYAALFGVGEHPGLDQITLAGLIAYDRTTIGGVIDRLEAKGLLRRAASPEDRRVRTLYLMPEGEELLKAISSTVAKIQDEILQPLGAEERSIFMLLLSKLVRAKNERTRVPMRPVKKR
ncbi:MarR family transcriptional regulator [Bosea sp. AK1]|uniref:MarR family winged helix-turn-helix transcriptional regulator n=1 Tax=Bosea sp. AK1 TaxID=2587160 RepID=UPI001152598F|nr:MarR family transcriptional regulator [Bosea sp. AK1]TQI65340.1 MarR family transcriptional regulator [Bosea sp. AK1]